MQIAKKILLLTCALVPLAGAAAAHHGWADYDPRRPVNLVGTVREVRYANPHVSIQLRTPAAGRTPARDWRVVLAPVARMQRKGIPEGRLQPGMTVRVIGERHRRIPQEAKIEWIVIGSDTAQIRTG
ncbi:MAG TPA: DUF6152 family protein [Longimicrobium sp.]|nr:DUF6152 family protein [Longimicrobium sp.]